MHRMHACTRAGAVHAAAARRGGCMRARARVRDAARRALRCRRSRWRCVRASRSAGANPQQATCSLSAKPGELRVLADPRKTRRSVAAGHWQSTAAIPPRQPVLPHTERWAGWVDQVEGSWPPAEQLRCLWSCAHTKSCRVELPDRYIARADGVQVLLWNNCSGVHLCCARSLALACCSVRAVG